MRLCTEFAETLPKTHAALVKEARNNNFCQAALKHIEITGDFDAALGYMVSALVQTLETYRDMAVKGLAFSAPPILVVPKENK